MTIEIEQFKLEMPCEIATADTCSAFFNESFTGRGKGTCVMCCCCCCLFFIAAVINRTNDPTSTIETLTSMTNAIDYAPYLFTFNITSILS